jgi:transposase
MKGTTVGDNFSPDQIEAIELMADGMLCEDVAQRLNVQPCTISRWRRNNQFMEAIVSRAREKLRDKLPTMYRVAANRAEEGSHAHLKIILDHLDNLETLASRNQDYNITFTWKPDDNTSS